MKTDREHLLWLHERITDFYKESPLVDFMHRFRYIIASIPKNRVSTGKNLSLNSTEDLRNYLLLDGEKELNAIELLKESHHYLKSLEMLDTSGDFDSDLNKLVRRIEKAINEN